VALSATPKPRTYEPSGPPDAHYRPGNRCGVHGLLDSGVEPLGHGRVQRRLRADRASRGHRQHSGDRGRHHCSPPISHRRTVALGKMSTSSAGLMRVGGIRLGWHCPTQHSTHMSQRACAGGGIEVEPNPMRAVVGCIRRTGGWSPHSVGRGGSCTSRHRHQLRPSQQFTSFSTKPWRRVIVEPCRSEPLRGVLLGCFVGAFDEPTVAEVCAGPDESDQVWCVDRTPAFLCGLDQLVGHGDSGRA
jgi:hypothetical protein